MNTLINVLNYIKLKKKYCVDDRSGCTRRDDRVVLSTPKFIFYDEQSCLQLLQSSNI